MGSNWVMKRIVTIVLSVVSLGMATSLASCSIPVHTFRLIVSRRADA